MDDIKYSQAIDRLRRAQPNNVALIEVLDEAQARIVLAHVPPNVQIAAAPNQKTDRKVYMRELMRKRRAERKAK